MHNAAPAGVDFAIPVVVQPQPGSAATACESLTVWVSYNDGRTWATARVVSRNGERFALLKHPNRVGLVSLRATATAERIVEKHGAGWDG